MASSSYFSITLFGLLSACAAAGGGDDTGFTDSCNAFYDAAISCADGASWDTTSYKEQQEAACTGWSAAAEAECGEYYVCMAGLYDGRDCADDADVQAINDGIAGCGSCAL